MLHVRICAGGGPQGPSLPRPDLTAPLCWIALTNPITGHCKGFNAVLYSHRHFQNDFATATDANRYWDARFNYNPTNPDPAYPSRLTDATVTGNCFTQALNDCCAGTWNYWMDTDCIGAAGATGAHNAIPDAIDGATETIAVAQRQALDILYYSNGAAGGGIHASYLDTVNPNGRDIIKWKYLGSGVYKWTEATAGFLDSPMKFGTDPTKQPEVLYPGLWQWNPAGAGDDSKLVPAGKVRRPKPAKN